MGLLEFKDLPAWAQVVASVAVFFTTSLVAVFGYLKPRIARKVEEQKSQDAVVISAAFADSKAISGLTKAVEELAASISKLIDLHEASHELHGRHIRALDYATEEIRRVTLEMVRRQ